MARGRWEARQSSREILHNLIWALTGEERVRLLYCGSGVQAMHLARRGHAVTAVDGSATALERLRRRAAACGINLACQTAGPCELAAAVRKDFPVAVAGENWFAPLLEEARRWLAAKSLWQKLPPGGVLLAVLPESGQRESTYLAGGRGCTVHDRMENGQLYALNRFRLREKENSFSLQQITKLRRVTTPDEFASLLEGAGFGELRWYRPEETGARKTLVSAVKQRRGDH